MQFNQCGAVVHHPIEEDTIMRRSIETEPVECGNVLQNCKQKMLSCVKAPSSFASFT